MLDGVLGFLIHLNEMNSCTEIVHTRGNMSAKNGFTLIELCIVIIIITLLTAVAVPKYRRVLETIKVLEAEEMLMAVRAEQERHCVYGKGYLTSLDDLDILKSSGHDPHFTYVLDVAGGGISAVRSDNAYDYALRMVSYKDGRICCAGTYCASLNHSYPDCTSIVVGTDECL